MSAHLETHFQRPDRIRDPLYVVAVLFNPVRWRSRWKLYQDFVKRCHAAGAIVQEVEVALGDRDFAVTHDSNRNHLQLRTRDPLWLKENAINLGVQRLPADWKYMAWIDADVTFVRDDWADETRHALQHYPVVQMWSEAHDLTDAYAVIRSHKSLGWCYCNGLWKHGQPDGAAAAPYYESASQNKVPYRHPGYAWAIRRDAFDAIGGLLDFSIIGSGDYHMAYALIGEAAHTLGGDYHPRFKQSVLDWQARAVAALHKDLGFIEGALLHHWHGSAADRRYNDRWRMLARANFNPDTDIFRDSQGLWQLSKSATGLKREIYDYLQGRNEDQLGIDE